MLVISILQLPGKWWLTSRPEAKYLDYRYAFYGIAILRKISEINTSGDHVKIQLSIIELILCSAKEHL
jgi:hypothetical protein